MEQVKEFLKNPKKTATLGLIFCALMVLVRAYSIISDNLFKYILDMFDDLGVFIGLTIYFIVIIMKMNKQKANVNMANNILIVCVAISAIFSLLPFLGLASIILLIVNVVIILYLYNIFYNKFTFINNIVFLFVIIVYIALCYIYPIISSSIINVSIYSIIDILAYLSFIPYFYNYYNLAKKENNQEDKEILQEIGIGETMTVITVNETNKDIRRDIYALFCKEISGSLKAPSTAVFCKEDELKIVKKNDMYYVSGWVDSQNSYGAMLRTNINDFKIKDENGILMIKSNARVMASNSFVKFFAANWLFSLIVTIATFAIIYAIISSL